MSELENTETPNELQGTVDSQAATIEKQGQDYASMMGRYKAAEDQLIALKAENDTLKASSTSSTGDDDPSENLKLKAEMVQMKEIVQKQELREERLKTVAKRQAIVKSLKAAGGDDVLSELAADSILRSSGDSIKTVDNSNGSFDVFHTDAIGTPTPIADFIGNQYMQTDAGKSILAAKKGPHIPGGSGDEPKSITKLSSLEYSRLSKEQRDSGNYGID